MAILARSQHGQASSADRVSTATLFTTIGALLGALGVAAVLWLGRINTRIQEQAETIGALKATVDETSAAQRLALDALLEGADRASPEPFTKLYGRAVHERDEVRRKLDSQTTINETLATEDQTLRSDNARLQTDLDKAATTGADRFQKRTPRTRPASANGSPNSKKRPRSRRRGSPSRMRSSAPRKPRTPMPCSASTSRPDSSRWPAGDSGALLTLGLIVVMVGRKTGSQEVETGGAASHP